jgi:ATP-binding cassette subfamily C protein
LKTLTSSLSDLLQRRGSRSQSTATSLSEFVRYIFDHARRPLLKAFGLLLAASTTEGLSLLLIVPLIGLLSPGHSSVEFHAPRQIAGPTHLSGAISVNLGVALVVFVVLVTARGFATRAKDIEVTGILYQISNDLRTRLFRALGQTRWGYISTLRVSDLNHALTADVDRVQTATMQLLLLAQALVMILIYSTMSFLISPSMTLFAVGLGALMLLALQPIRGRAQAHGVAFLQARREQFATVEEFLAGMKIVKAANAEAAYVARLGAGLDDLRSQTIRYMRTTSLAALGLQAATAGALASFVAVAFFGMHLSREVIILLLVLFLRIGPRLTGLQAEMQDLLVNLSSFGAMRKLELACAAEAETDRIDEVAPRLQRSIQLQDVHFRYLGADKFALRELNAIIPAFKVTAIIGASGGGKSTLSDLLLGLEGAQSGQIVVDGSILEGATRRAWRNEVAYVPQETFLLNDTLAANLRLMAPQASEADLWHVLASAQLSEVVRKLPHGLGTYIGDRGIRLSGGERQRLALARALLRKPQLLLLDEATSALDWENQSAIARVITSLRGHCTIVTIAHRPSMIDFADWVIALDGGRVVETGAFAALAADPTSMLAQLLAAEAH